MPKWLRTSLLVVLALALVVIAAGATFYVVQPTSFAFARARTMPAAPDVIHPHLADLRAFVAWDPWPSRAPVARTVTFSTESAGPGAWVEARDPDGVSRITIVSVSATRIEMRNETSGPLASGASLQVFELRPVAAGGTDVTWTFGGELHGLGRALWPFVGLEGRVGPELEAGLGRLEAAL